MTDAERKMHERKLVEEADHQLTEDLFGLKSEDSVETTEIYQQECKCFS